MRAEDASAQGPQATRSTRFAQLFLGVLCRFGVCAAYQRRTVGLRDLPRRRCLYVSNHVSLLDTLILGGNFFGVGRLPFLVLGDLTVWEKSWLRRLLASRIGFLIDRTRLSKDVVRQLKCFGRAHRDFELLVFPEGTRGDGVTVKTCQPGIASIARAARIPIVPVFIENMQRVTSKTTPFRPVRGLRQIVVHYGAPWSPDEYLELSPDALREGTRERIQALRPRT